MHRLIRRNAQRPLRMRRSPQRMPPLREEIEYRTMRRNAIIPEHDRVLPPPYTDLEIGVVAELVEEEGEDGVGLGFGHADDLAREAGVDEDGFPACDGVHADDWVHGFDFLAADVGSGCARADRLGGTGVDSGERLEVLLEEWRERRVECVAGRQNRMISTSTLRVEEVRRTRCSR